MHQGQSSIHDFPYCHAKRRRGHRGGKRGRRGGVGLAGMGEDLQCLTA